MTLLAAGAALTVVISLAMMTLGWANGARTWLERKLKFRFLVAMGMGPLKQDILLIAQANGVPADNVYVFDVSRQSNRITANVSGMFGTTRISLSDTLIARASPEAVRHVMAHEIGHCTLNHQVSDLTMLGVTIAILRATKQKSSP